MYGYNVCAFVRILGSAERQQVILVAGLAANSRGDIAIIVEEALPSMNIFQQVGFLLSAV